MKAVRNGTSTAGKSRPALLGSRTALGEMRTETILLLYKSRLFDQNERRKLTFRQRILFPEKKKKGYAPVQSSTFVEKMAATQDDFTDSLGWVDNDSVSVIKFSRLSMRKLSS